MGSQANEISIDLSDLDAFRLEEIPEDFFGGVYSGYRSILRFDFAVDSAGLSNIRWPGGAVSEKEDSWYGFQYPDLVDPDSNKAGLSDVLAYAVENELPLTVIIPTVIFSGSESTGRQELRNFLEKLKSGDLGELPPKLVLELGNEYYAQEEFKNNPAAYGNVINELLLEFRDFLADNPNAFPETEVSVAAQSGRNVTENSAILNEISESAVAAIDMLVAHRFSWGLNDAGSKIADVESAIEAWIDAGADPAVDLFISAWNVASWTRSEALSDYQNTYDQIFGIMLDLSEIDEANRANTSFERFWQTGVLIGPNGEEVATKFGLANRDYGLSQASAMIEVVSQYISIGADFSSLYGIDHPYPGHVSFGNDIFVGGSILSMLAETLPNMWYVETGLTNYRPANESEYVNTWVFANDERAAIYLSANDFNELEGPLEQYFDLSTLERVISNIEIRSLTSESSTNWMDLYGIVDNENIDETPESLVYEYGVITDFGDTPWTQDGLSISFAEDYQVFEIVLEFSDGLKLIGTTGNDNLVGTNSQDIIKGGDGEDRIFGQDGNDEIDGGNSADFIYAGDGNDKVNGGFGQDWVDLGSGDDFYDDTAQNGFYGADTVFGGTGDDEIWTRGGDDLLYGGTGNDILNSGSGDDIIHPGEGEDIINGGGGYDTISFENFISSVNVYLLEGGAETESGLNLFVSIEAVTGSDFSDTLNGSLETNTIFGMGGDDAIRSFSGEGNYLSGGGGDDYIESSFGSARIDGGAGDDVIMGIKSVLEVDAGSGNDLVNAGSGNDRIMGNTGNDTLVGGLGSDTFIFGLDDGSDRVQDFNPTTDIIEFIEGGIEDVSAREELIEGSLTLVLDFGDTEIALNGLSLAEYGSISFEFV